jgi:6-phosphogluconate dehydrogenase (decarboxylating)
VWVMLPSGRLTEQTIARLCELMIAGATFAEKVLSAMRFGFGGHVEQPASKP